MRINQLIYLLIKCNTHLPLSFFLIHGGTGLFFGFFFCSSTASVYVGVRIGEQQVPVIGENPVTSVTPLLSDWVPLTMATPLPAPPWGGYVLDLLPWVVLITEDAIECLEGVFIILDQPTAHLSGVIYSTQ